MKTKNEVVPSKIQSYCNISLVKMYLYILYFAYIFNLQVSGLHLR